jgi:serine/threonine-protein kinase
MQVLNPGILLDHRYCIAGDAGQNQFGLTYLAQDQQQNQQLCVIKEFIPVERNSDVLANWVQSLQAELTATKLQHPQLPQFQAVFLQEQKFYWVREYIEGKSLGIVLNDRLTQGNPFSETEVLHLLEQILPVLDYLHQQGVVHHNLSLHNIILRREDQLPVLVDLGLVFDLMVQLPLQGIATNFVIGHPGYAPPEQLAGGEIFASSDLYALAAVAIALLTGKPAEMLYDPASQTFDWESTISLNPKFARLLRRLLNPELEKRFVSADQVMRAVKTVQRDLAIAPVNQAEVVDAEWVDREPARSTPPAASRRPVRRKPRKQQRFSRDVLATGAVVTGLALLVAVFAVRVLPSLLSPSKPEVTTSPTSGTREVSPSPTSGRSTLPPTIPVPALPPPPTVDGQKPNITDLAQEPIRQRRSQLGLNDSFFVVLVNELKPGQIEGSPNPEQFRAEWNAIASSVLDRLGQLSPATRGKLGSYSIANYNAWLKELGEPGAKSKKLDSLADPRFYELFPDQRGKPLNPQTFGQIWFAIAEEKLPEAKNIRG